MQPHLYTIRKKDESPRTVKLSCQHEDSWPPTSALLKNDPERLRQKKVINDAAYESHKVWATKCGKMSMDDGCASCDLSRARARVITRGTGRHKNKEIEFAAFMRTARTDVTLIYERVEPDATEGTT